MKQQITHLTAGIRIAAFIIVPIFAVAILPFGRAYADPTTTEVTCKDGEPVTATRSGSAFTDADYEKACAKHGGYKTPTANSLITCEDGQIVSSGRSGDKYTVADYQKACKNHGGYDSARFGVDSGTDSSSGSDSGSSSTVGTGSTGGSGDGKDCNATFLGIPAWYRGMQDDTCAFKAPETNGQADAKKLVLMIALNVIQAGMAIVGYVTIFFLIKGGFGYITSAGSSDGMAAAKKTITNALVGLVIAILAASIVNAIAGAIK